MTQELQLLYLLEEDRYKSTMELMEKIPYSEKTLRMRIRALDEILRSHGAYIENKRGHGYRLVVEKREQFLEYSRHPHRENEAALPDNGTERTIYILTVLLHRNGYVKREELAEFLCVSEKTVTADIRQAEFILKQYDLKIERKPSYGMRITGEEFQKRQCILNHLILMEPSEFFRKELDVRKAGRVGDIVQKVMAQFHMNISELPFQNLVYYLLVMIHRIRHGYEIMGEECTGWKKEVGIYQASEAILQGLREEKLLETYREGEIYFTSLFLWGNRVVENPCQKTVNYVILGRVENLAGKLIQYIYEEFKIDFRADFNLRMCLINHLASLDVRLRHGIHIENPYLQEIREQYFFCFLVAQYVCFVVGDDYGKKLSEDEVGYFALLFAMKLNEEKKERKMNILLFCATGKIGSQFLKFRLEEEFKEDIREIDMHSIYEIEEINFEKYDYIFSTIPIDKPVPVPVLMIRDFFDSAEIGKLHQEVKKQESYGNIQDFYCRELFFTDLAGSTREEVLHEMCQRITDRFPSFDGLEALVLEREHLGGTDFGNLSAMPHPLRSVGEKNIVSVGILKEPIVWEKNKVQLVVLAAVRHTKEEEVQKFFSMTAHLLLDENAVKQVIREKNYECFLALLWNASKQVRKPYA